MTLRIYIDPGIKCTGLAAFNEGRLVDVQAFRSRTVHEACAHARRYMIKDEDRVTLEALHASVIVERPQIYAAAKQDGDPNDLIAIALVAGAWSVVDPVRAFFALPFEWKGNLPKEQVHDRMWGALDAKEQDYLRRAVAGLGKLAHNVYDAVSMGLVDLERMRLR